MKALNPAAVKMMVNKVQINMFDLDLTDGIKGAMISILEDTLVIPGHKVKADQRKGRRYQVLGYLFSPDNTPMSSKDLSPENWIGLKQWINPQKQFDKWVSTRLVFPVEARMVLSDAIYMYQHPEQPVMKPEIIEFDIDKPVYDAALNLEGVVTRQGIPEPPPNETEIVLPGRTPNEEPPAPAQTIVSTAPWD